MKNKFVLFLMLVVLLSACSTGKKLTNDPNREDWIDLFNGKDLNDWVVKTHKHEVGEDTLDTYRVEDGMLKVRYDKYGDYNDQFSHLYYKKPLSYYHFTIDYQFTGEQQKGAPDYAILNSGVMFHALSPYTMLKNQNWPISIELQFLSSLGNGKDRATGNMCSPGTNVVYNGKLDERHIIPSSAKTYAKDEWVTAELIVLGDSLVTHIINGETVLQYSKPQIGGGVVDGYDPAVKINGKILSEGYIALQSESQPINFKNIKLLELKGCMNPAYKSYKSYFVAHDQAACK